MAGRQPAWVRRADLTEQQTAVLAAPPGRGGAEATRAGATRYGAPPAALVAGLTVLLPLVAFALLLAGKTVAAAALALVAFVLAIMFGSETRELLRFAGYGAWEWSVTGARVAELRVERRRSQRRLDGALRELGSATYDEDDDRIRLAQARAHDAAAFLDRACDEEARLVERTRTRVHERRRRR
jgi:hypothetical protein